MSIILKPSFSEEPRTLTNVRIIHQSALELYILLNSGSDLTLKLSEVDYFVIINE